MKRRVPVHSWNPGRRPSAGETPFVLRDAAPRLLPGWSLDWLLKTCGGVRVPVQKGDARISMSLTRAVRLANMSRRSAGSGFRHAAPYVTDWDFSRIIELRDRYVLPAFARKDPILEMPPERRPRLIWIYFGGPGSGTPLHRDVVALHAWSILISGGKEWIFYPPDTDFGEEPAKRNVFAPGAEKADERAGRERWSAAVGPGDLIFVPSRWWHQVRNLEPTLAVGGNFIDSTIAPTVYRECERLDYPHIAYQLIQSYGPGIKEAAA